jgi:hypothetical protein
MSIDPIDIRNHMIDELLKAGSISPKEARQMREIVQEYLAIPVFKKSEVAPSNSPLKWIIGAVSVVSLIAISYILLPLIQDTDSDGIRNYYDQCPEVYGTKACDGCSDRDLDSVRDDADVCPDIPGLSSLDGCNDYDSDGITDAYDDCPLTAGDSGQQGCSTGSNSLKVLNVKRLSREAMRCDRLLQRPGTQVHEKTTASLVHDTVFNASYTSFDIGPSYNIYQASIETRQGNILVKFYLKNEQLFCGSYTLNETSYAYYVNSGKLYDFEGKILTAQPEFSTEVQQMLAYLYIFEKIFNLR